MPDTPPKSPSPIPGLTEAIQDLGKLSLADISSQLNELVNLPKIDYSALLPPVPHNPVLENLQANWASQFYEFLVEWIDTFNKSLDEQHEVGAHLVSFGRELVFHIEGLGYQNPSLLRFFGVTDDGNPVQLIQHVSQLSVLLVKLPRLDPKEAKWRIGYADGTQPDSSGG